MRDNWNDEPEFSTFMDGYWKDREEDAEARAEITRLRTALKPFAEIGRRLHEANQRSDQSTLIGASARFLKLEPLTGHDFVAAHLAISPQDRNQ